MPTKKGYQKAQSDDLEVSLISEKYNSGTSITSNTSPMDRFRRYEEDFLNSSRIVNRGLKELSNCKGVVDQVISVSVEIDSELSETEGYLRAMDVEFRGMMSSEKKNASQKVSEYREEYKQLLQQFQQSKHQAESDALKSGPAARVKLVSANQRLDQSTATLENSRMLIAQSEATGNVIIEDLTSQKQSLQGAQSKVQETQQFTQDAKGILQTMFRRAIMHNVIMAIIIFVLFGIICIIAYFGLISNDSK